MTEQEAGHAWAEAFVPDLGWVAFDAANGICATDAHVRVAVGLDYLGAAPVRGSRYGGGGEALDVAVRVNQVAARASGRAERGSASPRGYGTAWISGVAPCAACATLAGSTLAGARLGRFGLDRCDVRRARSAPCAGCLRRAILLAVSRAGGSSEHNSAALFFTTMPPSEILHLRRSG